MKKILAIILTFAMVFTSVFANGFVAKAGGAEGEEGELLPDEDVTNVVISVGFVEEGYYPATLQYVIDNFRMNVTFADGTTTRIGNYGWLQETSYEDGKEVGTGVYVDSDTRSFFMKFYDLQGNQVKITDDCVPVGEYIVEITRKVSDNVNLQWIETIIWTSSAAEKNNLIIKSPTEVVKSYTGNTADFTGNTNKFEENWYSMENSQSGLETGKEYIYTPNEFNNNYWFTSIWSFENGVATRVNEGTRGDQYNVTPFGHTYSDLSNMYLVIGETSSNNNKAGSVSWNMKRDISKIELNPAESYKMWNNDFYRIPVVVTYTDGSQEICTDWSDYGAYMQYIGSDGGTWTGSNGLEVTTSNGDVICLAMKNAEGQWVESYESGYWKPGTTVWTAYVEKTADSYKNPEIFANTSIVIADPDIVKLDYHSEIATDFNISEDNEAYFSYDVDGELKEIEICNYSSQSMGYDLYRRELGSDSPWKRKSSTLVWDQDTERENNLELGYEYLIILETSYSNSGTIGIYVANAKTKSATVETDMINLEEGWSTLPVKLNFVGSDDNIIIGSQTIQSWSMTGNPVILSGKSKYNEKIYCALYDGNSQVSMGGQSTGSSLDELLKLEFGIEDPSQLSAGELEELKMLLMEMGYDISSLESSSGNAQILEGNYTLKVYKDSVNDANLIGSKSIKIVNKSASYEIDSVKISSKKLVQNGSSRVPTVTIKNTSGDKLVKETDYTLTVYNSKGKQVTSPKAVGTYTIKVTYKGNYADNEESEITYHIVPKAVTNIKAQLVPEKGYNKVKVSWKKSEGATGYYVYYKKNSAESYTNKNLKSVSGNNVTISNLSAGTKYNFKVVPYFGTNKVTSNKNTVVNKTTLKKVAGVKVTRSGKKVKVSWTNIAGETGYQISRSTSKSNTANIKTYSGENLKSKTISLSSAKKYYYKVRAYKTENGKKVFGPWSAAVYK